MCMDVCVSVYGCVCGVQDLHNAMFTPVSVTDAGSFYLSVHGDKGVFCGPNAPLTPLNCRVFPPPPFPNSSTTEAQTADYMGRLGTKKNISYTKTATLL